MNPNTKWVINWITRMTQKYGSRVWEKEFGFPWDWGQAICREQYGPDWNDIVPEDPTRDDVYRAQQWEKGNWPNWVDLERMDITVVTKE